MSNAAVMAKLDEMAQVQAGLVQGVAKLGTQMELISSQMSRLVVVLTPERRQRDGIPLAEVLAKLVERLDRQNALLQDVAETIARAVVEIPEGVARIMAEAISEGSEPGQA